MTDERDRYDQAFRTAFTQQAESVEPVELDSARMARAARRRTWWRTGTVAAAVLTLVGGTAVAASIVDGGSRDPVTQEASGSPTDRAATEESAASSPATPDTTDPRPDREPLPAPESGWRYESLLDAVVQVPVSWPYAQAPGSDWCASTGESGEPRFPTEPFVATNRPHDGVLAILCPTPKGPGAPDREIFGWAPVRYWAPHVRMYPADAFDAPPEGVFRHGEWTLSSQMVGSTTITVLADPAHQDMAEQIMDSASVVSTDHHGCDVASRIQEGHFVRPDPAFDVTTLAGVDAISVCQYDLARQPSEPGLLGSHVLTGSDASAELAALQAAAPGGGPDDPNNCVDYLYGDTAIVLRLHAGQTTYDMYAYYEWCFGNGFDDGTTLRELTREACLPIWGGNVLYSSGSSEPYRRCHE
jgi:hypothetical protein